MSEFGENFSLLNMLTIILRVRPTLHVTVLEVQEACLNKWSLILLCSLHTYNTALLLTLLNMFYLMGKPWSWLTFKSLEEVLPKIISTDYFFGLISIDSDLGPYILTIQIPCFNVLNSDFFPLVYFSSNCVQFQLLFVFIFYNFLKILFY